MKMKARLKVFSSWNGGKRSWIACYKALSDGFDVSHLLDIFEYGLSGRAFTREANVNK
ncbi:MAG: hypothetical protein WA977_07525 [Halobacteriota archaeon]